MEEFIKKFMCCPILQYNHFKIEPDENMGYCTSIEKFEKDITSLLKFGYSSISLYQLYLYKINNIDLPNNTFCIIMEGGYESNYVLAFDILKKHNIHADIFISTDLVGLKCHPKYPNFIPHFSWDQATEMINSGLVNIYAKWHPLDENKGEFKKVILDKKEELMSHLDQKQYIGNFFAFLYPYYDEKKIDDIFSIGINTQIIDYLKLTKENISKGCVGSIPVNFYTDVLDVIDEYKDILMFNTGKRESIKQDIDVDIQYNNFMSLNLESIKLPIFEKPMIKNYLRHAFPLSILFVDREEKYNKFILSNNIQLIANPLFLEFDYHNHYYSYWPCITCNRVTSDILRINNIDILSYIYKGLQNGYYSDIWLDSYYIPGKPAYKYYHLTHGLLIFGYDHEKKFFKP